MWTQDDVISGELHEMIVVDQNNAMRERLFACDLESAIRHIGSTYTYEQDKVWAVPICGCDGRPTVLFVLNRTCEFEDLSKHVIRGNVTMNNHWK